MFSDITFLKFQMEPPTQEGGKPYSFMKVCNRTTASSPQLKAQVLISVKALYIIFPGNSQERGNKGRVGGSIHGLKS